LPQLLARDDDGIAETIAGYQRAFSWLSDGPAVSIALVQGHAVGAGFQLALAADLVVCSADAKFSMREASYGLVPDLTGTSPLVRAVGYQRALEICLSTRWVEANEALRLGLTVAVVPDAADLAKSGDLLVAAVTNAVPGTAAALKHVLRSAVTAGPADQRRVERLAQVGRLRTLAELMSGQAEA
jgi:enoyl-CoA hydratase/carnithine racemase